MTCTVRFTRERLRPRMQLHFGPGYRAARTSHHHTFDTGGVGILRNAPQASHRDGQETKYGPHASMLI